MRKHHRGIHILTLTCMKGINNAICNFTTRRNDYLLVTRGSIEPHYDWVVKMKINANPCPTWV